MKKRVLIDASTVTSQVDGLSHSIINLIKYLPEDSFELFDYTILINKGLERKGLTDLLKNDRFQVIEEKIAPIGPKRDWHWFWFLRKYKNKFDLVHITSNNYPFALKNGISTITDITFKEFFDNPKFTFNLAPIYMDMVIRNSLRNARALAAISSATRNNLIKTYQLDKTTSEKIHVIHLGWEHIINEVNASAEPCVQPLVANNDYLLYVGTFRIHKNISNLLLAFHQAMASLPVNKKLVIIGNDKYLKDNDREVIKAINLNGERVFFTGYLSQACVEKYFQQADAYIFPSLSEGFGLGVLEAFYYNIPLLCSNLTSLPEIAGNAAMYFNPYEVGEIAKSITDYYATPGLREELIAKGKERLKEFSWKKHAVETAALYQKLLF